MPSFSHEANRIRDDTGHLRHIVCTVDGHHDGLIDKCASVISHTRRVGLRNSLTLLERLGCRQRVIERVGPNARGCINADRAIGRRWRTNNAPH